MFQRRRQGDHLTLRVLCTNGSFTPANPTLPPSVAVYQDDGTKPLFQKKMAIEDRGGQTGLFKYVLFLDAGYEVGLYRATYQYQLSGVSYLKEEMFQVIAGGDEDGVVIAMHWFPLPHAKFIVYQRTDGTLAFGKNPKT